jgi:hypothetical protein
MVRYNRLKTGPARKGVEEEGITKLLQDRICVTDEKHGSAGGCKDSGGLMNWMVDMKCVQRNGNRELMTKKKLVGWDGWSLGEIGERKREGMGG